MKGRGGHRDPKGGTCLSISLHTPACRYCCAVVLTQGCFCLHLDRRSVVVDGETGAVVVQDLDDGEGITLEEDKGNEEEKVWAVEKVPKQVIKRPPARHLDDVGPDGCRVYPACFTGSMELEPGVLAWAMREDEAAEALQVPQSRRPPARMPRMFWLIATGFCPRKPSMHAPRHVLRRLLPGSIVQIDD